MQKEAFFHNKNCIVLRNETEWSEITTNCKIVDISNFNLKLLKFKKIKIKEIYLEMVNQVIKYLEYFIKIIMIYFALPAYNEEHSIKYVFKKIQNVMADHQLDYFLIICNDGSTTKLRRNYQI